MKVYVSKSNVNLQDGYIINRNEYKANTLEFEFTEEYTDDLVKKAIFVSGDTKIEVAILNNECDIPYEVLDKEQFELRVYAYEIQDEELILRYSPTYTNVFTREGSYIEGGSDPEVITPTQFEEYMQAMNDGLVEVNRIDIDAEKVGKVTTITLTDKEGITKTIQISDGEKGEQGEKGDNTPVKGVDYWTAEDKTEIINDVLSQIQDSEEVYY